MKWFQKFLDRLFVEGMSGMAQGVFVTFVVGTILEQIGIFVPGSAGNELQAIGKVAISLTCVGIGIGVASKLHSHGVVILSAALLGMLLSSKEQLTAFLAVYVAVEIGQFLSGKTKLDLLLVPALMLFVGAFLGNVINPPIHKMMTGIASIISWGTTLHPFFMGIVIAVTMGIGMTLPISAVALGAMTHLSGLAAGAAAIGCCCQMIGFAMASFRENGISGFLLQGFGSSMLQMPNIVRNPLIWLPPILSSIVLGPLGTMAFHAVNSKKGASLGATAFIAQRSGFHYMSASGEVTMAVLKMMTIYVILPAIVTLAISEWMRKKKWIKQGDMKIDTAFH